MDVQLHQSFLSFFLRQNKNPILQAVKYNIKTREGDSSHDYASAEP